jgi:hypothetical protein
MQRAIVEGIPAKGMPAFGDRLGKEDVTVLVQLITSDKPAGPSTGANPYAGVVRHPDGWIGRHFTVVKESGTQLCSRCHQPSYCVNCHTAGRVKP